MSRPFDISITVFLRGERHVIMTQPGEYRSLMVLLHDKFCLEDFGECKGTGRCGTCHVYLLNGAEELLNKSGNETTTLSRMDFAHSHSRLACQMVIDEKLHGLYIELVSGDEPGTYSS